LVGLLSKQTTIQQISETVCAKRCVYGTDVNYIILISVFQQQSCYYLIKYRI